MRSPKILKQSFCSNYYWSGPSGRERLSNCVGGSSWMSLRQCSRLNSCETRCDSAGAQITTRPINCRAPLSSFQNIHKTSEQCDILAQWTKFPNRQ
jgi:hypothetical protein